MSESVKFTHYKTKAGFAVRGGPKVEPPKHDLHMARAFYIVSQLEAANWGTVQNYDGAAMSAGPLHVIGVYPATGRQGPLWGMVRRVFDASGSGEVLALKRKLGANGWYVNDNFVRDAAGQVVHGSSLVEQLSGPDGVVPSSGPVHERAKGWAIAFHRAFADPASYPGQYEGTLDWLLANFDTEADAYRKYVPGLTGSDEQIKQWVRTANMAQVGPYLDLAMSVYHAFSVNAPGKAKQILGRMLALNLDVRRFARALTNALGSDSYGNWRERGRRTILAVGRSGLWPPEIVKDIYPSATAISMIAYATEGAPYALALLLLLGGTGLYVYRHGA
jgi:hypothetical protein